MIRIPGAEKNFGFKGPHFSLIQECQHLDSRMLTSRFRNIYIQGQGCLYKNIYGTERKVRFKMCPIFCIFFSGYRFQEGSLCTVHSFSLSLSIARVTNTNLLISFPKDVIDHRDDDQIQPGLDLGNSTHIDL